MFLLCQKCTLQNFPLVKISAGFYLVSKIKATTPIRQFPYFNYSVLYKYFESFSENAIQVNVVTSGSP